MSVFIFSVHFSRYSIDDFECPGIALILRLIAVRQLPEIFESYRGKLSPVVQSRTKPHRQITNNQQKFELINEKTKLTSIAERKCDREDSGCHFSHVRINEWDIFCFGLN